jgi:hypothetical protein
MKPVKSKIIKAYFVGLGAVLSLLPTLMALAEGGSVSD